MIFGHGIDIVSIARFERFVAENNIQLLQRLFTGRERDYCAAKRFSAQHYALRFAAKEAFLKALGTGLRDGLSWQDMEIVNDQLGKPRLNLSGRAMELYQEHEIDKVLVSLSHDGDCAIASVILEQR
jgi:holo-[acyl-carrier protein] synthase